MGPVSRKAGKKKTAAKGAGGTKGKSLKNSTIRAAKGASGKKPTSGKK